MWQIKIGKWFNSLARYWVDRFGDMKLQLDAKNLYRIQIVSYFELAESKYTSSIHSREKFIPFFFGLMNREWMDLVVRTPSFKWHVVWKHRNRCVLKNGFLKCANEQKIKNGKLGTEWIFWVILGILPNAMETTLPNGSIVNMKY